MKGRRLGERRSRGGRREEEIRVERRSACVRVCTERREMSEGGMGREERESRLRYLRMRFLVRLLAIFKVLAEESGEPVA